MSYVDGSDEDYGGDYPSKDDTVYSYEGSANSLETSIVSSAAASTSRTTLEPACSVQETNDQAAAAKALDEFNKAQGAHSLLDYEIQKLQSELEADPHKLDDTKCFGPPARTHDFLDKAPEFPFQEDRPEEDPEFPDKLYKDPFAKIERRMDWRTRLILQFFEDKEEELP